MKGCKIIFAKQNDFKFSTHYFYCKSKRDFTQLIPVLEPSETESSGALPQVSVSALRPGRRDLQKGAVEPPPSPLRSLVQSQDTWREPNQPLIEPSCSDPDSEQPPDASSESTGESTPAHLKTKRNATHQ